MANEASGGSTAGIGTLLNAGAGTFPANAAFTPGGTVPTSVAVGNFILNPVPAPAPATTADAALADDNGLGGVTIIPSDGLGNFTGGTYVTTNAAFTVAVAKGNFTGAGASIVAVSGGNAAGTAPSIEIILHDTTAGSPPITVNIPVPSGDVIDPRAVVVGDFNGDGVPDFAVLSGSPTSVNDSLTVFVNTTLPGGTVSFNNVAQFNLGAGAVAMAPGFLTGSTIFSDLAVVFNTANALDLTVLKNTSSAANVSFSTHVITGSVFPGTAVSLATGTLYGSPTAGFQDIAVVYAATGGGAIPANESMVAVFQNAQIGFGFLRTPDPLTGGDYDAGATFTGTLATGSASVTVTSTTGLFAGEPVYGIGIPPMTTIQTINSATGITLSANATVTGAQTLTASQTNPTAITVAALGGTAGTWNSIVVTNKSFGGTVSVLAPIARPTPPTAPSVSTFEVNVNIPNPAALTDLTVFLEVTDTALADLKIVLVAPNGASITLITNQFILVGTTVTQTSANVGIAGNSMGIFDYSPGPPTVPGFPVGTIFDDNATNDIVNLNPVGDYGAPTPPITAGRGAETDYIGHWRPESELINGETLAAFIAAAKASGKRIQRAMDSAGHRPDPHGFRSGPGIQSPVQFDTDYQRGRHHRQPIQLTFTSTDGTATTLSPRESWSPGSLSDVYPTAIPAAPATGVGPDVVLAEDNTLGPDSPYQGRIYAAFVGYFAVANPRGLNNPTTNTDIFLVYSDDHGASWSAPELINDDQATSDGDSQANDNLVNGSDQITGRTQFQPEIAVDQSTGTVVLSWRDARDDAANARVATYITTSLDGGNTFSPQTYANPAKTAVDAITGKTNVIGPASDNQSSGNPQTDTNFNYGSEMGLAVADGQIFPIWAGNFYGPNPQDSLTSGGNLDSFYNTSTGAVTAFPLNIWYQPMTIAAGPRIISSTMGPVVANTLTGSAIDLPQFIPPPFTLPGTTTSSVIPITGDPSLNVSSLEVTVSLIYPTDGNLTLTLFAPDGKSVILYHDPSDTGQSFTNTTFSDSASHSITTGKAPYTGTFKPLNPLSIFDGIQAVGNWTLSVSGGIGPNGGILQSWSLSIAGVAAKPTSFEVTFDRPIDPIGVAPTFTPADVTVLYHDTKPNTAADPPIPVLVTNVVPVQVPPYYDGRPDPRWRRRLHDFHGHIRPHHVGERQP